MAEPNQNTPPPTVNTPRPNLHDRASQRRPKPSGGFVGYLAFLAKAVSLVVLVFGAFYVYQNVLTKAGAAQDFPKAVPPDGSSRPEGVATELRGFLQGAGVGGDIYRTPSEQMALLVKQAKSGTPGTKPLAEALSEQQDAERLASAAVVEAEAAKAREEATRRKAAAEVERLKSEEAAAARIATVKAEQARELGLKEEARLQEETRMLKVKADQARIRRLAEDPAIQAQFAPFLAKGRWKWSHVFGAESRSDFPEPSSYTALTSSGCLKDEKTFAAAMAGYFYPIPSGRNQLGNDRPHAPYPSTQEAMNRRAQQFELFKELAPTWIEMGKLLP